MCKSRFNKFRLPHYHMVKKSRDLMGEFSPNLSHPFSNFGDSRSFGKSDVKVFITISIPIFTNGLLKYIGSLIILDTKLNREKIASYYNPCTPTVISYCR